MELTPDNKLRKLILVGDKVLIKPRNFNDKTKSGLYLPQTVLDKEEVQSGHVIHVGPGYAIPSSEPEESWKSQETNVKYMPLQAQEGDIAVFLQKHSWEVMYEEEKYLIVPHQSILMLIRDEVF